MFRKLRKDPIQKNSAHNSKESPFNQSACMEGTLLRITQVKPECKKAMSARDFAQGARLLCGEDWASCLKVREEE